MSGSFIERNRNNQSFVTSTPLSDRLFPTALSFQSYPLNQSSSSFAGKPPTSLSGHLLPKTSEYSTRSVKQPFTMKTQGETGGHSITGNGNGNLSRKKAKTLQLFLPAERNIIP